MSEPKHQNDAYTGIPWVYIDPDQARALPQGKLGLVLWLIVVYFVAIAVLKFGWVISLGAGLGIAVLNSIWPLLAGAGLALRSPWSMVMAMIASAVTVLALARGLGEGSSLINLLETILNIGILFYLIDGDRPNLIYRHRYRKYSVERADAAEDMAADGGTAGSSGN